MHVAHSQLPPPPARIPLRSRHLRWVSSRPAELNINYRQDVATLCMGTNKSDSVAAHHATPAHTLSMRPKWLWREPWPCKPSQSLLPVAATSLPPPAFSASPVLIRRVDFAPSMFPQLKSGGHPRFSLPMRDDCEPHRISPYSSISYVCGTAWTSLLWWNADREQRAG